MNTELRSLTLQNLITVPTHNSHTRNSHTYLKSHYFCPNENVTILVRERFPKINSLYFKISDTCSNFPITNRLLVTEVYDLEFLKVLCNRIRKIMNKLLNKLFIVYKQNYRYF